jgi:ABC-2 type transport system ATP-binding protein
MVLLKLLQLPIPSHGEREVPIDLEVAAGQCVALQCNDEQGRALVGRITGTVTGPPEAVLYREKPLRLKGDGALAHIGLCRLDDGDYPRLKVKAYLEFWSRLYGVRRSIGDLLQSAGLLSAMDSAIARLNASERRRLNLVRSVLHDPELILLENPEQGLDLEGCAIVRRMVASWTEQGKAVLVTCSSPESAISLTGDAYRLTDQGMERLATRDESEPIGLPARQDGEAEQVSLSRIAKIPARAEDKVILVDPAEILYVESSDGQSLLHLEAETLTCMWTLNDLDQRLEPFHFYRCHRSYIVNLQRVRELIVWTRNSYSLILSDRGKRAVPLSKGRYEELKRIIGI